MKSDNKVIQNKKKDDQAQFNKWAIDPGWLFIFVVSMIVNLALGYWVLWETDYGRIMSLGLLGIIPMIGIVAIIDLIMIISFIRKRHHEGRAKVISYIALIALIILLISALRTVPYLL